MTKKIVGLIIMVIALLLLLSNLDIISIENIWNYIWPIALIIVGILGMCEKKGYDFFCSIITVIGILFLIKAFGIITINIIGIVFAPLVIFGIGLSLFINYSKFIAIDGEEKKYHAIFSGVEDKLEDKKYKGSDIFAIFGGVKLDLRKVVFDKKTALINITSIFGGVEIIVPENIRVIAKGIPIFGGCTNKTESNDKYEYELLINYNVIFGGVEIKK